MKVALDAQLTVGTATGIGEYVRGLLGALAGGPLEIVGLSDPKLDPWRFDRRVLWDQMILPRRARESGAEILHCASGTMPRRSALPMVVTVHDLAWMYAQSHAPFYARYYFGRFSLARYPRARAIVADSGYSRAVLLDLLPSLDSERVHVVYPGVAADYCEIVRRGDHRTILAIGTVERRKNLELLIRAMARLPQARLVAVGPTTPYADECRALARTLAVDDRVELRGYVAREELLALVASAAVIAVPSRYEGFGYAAAQALCAGVPAIVSDRTSLPEVVGGDAPVVPIDDLDAWVSALTRALAGEGDARAEAARADARVRFSWQNAAALMSRVYQSAMN